MEAVHATQTGGTAASTRRNARRYAREIGVAEPEWCKARFAGRPQKAAPPASQGFGSRRLKTRALPATTEALPVEVPAHDLERLRAWRASQPPGTIVQIKRDAVIVHPYQQPPRSFRDLPSAVAELCGQNAPWPATRSLGSESRL